MRFSSYLLCREGHFYFQIKVPADLRRVFSANLIKKSLRTSNSKDAALLVGTWTKRVLSAFALIRSGALNEEQTCSLVETIIPRKRGSLAAETAKLPQTTSALPFSPPPSIRLSEAIKLYSSEHSPQWTPKTRLEFEWQLQLLLTVVGLRHNYAQERMEELQRNGMNYDDAKGTVAQEVGHFDKETTEAYLR